MGRIKVCGAQNAGSNPRGPVLFSGNNPVQPSKPAVQQVSSKPIQKDLSGLTTRTPGRCVFTTRARTLAGLQSCCNLPSPQSCTKEEKLSVGIRIELTHIILPRPPSRQINPIRQHPQNRSMHQIQRKGVFPQILTKPGLEKALQRSQMRDARNNKTRGEE